jgi:hypothetical protein
MLTRLVAILLLILALFNFLIFLTGVSGDFIQILSGKSFEVHIPQQFAERSSSINDVRIGSVNYLNLFQIFIPLSISFFFIAIWESKINGISFLEMVRLARESIGWFFIFIFSLFITFVSFVALSVAIPLAAASLVIMVAHLTNLLLALALHFAGPAIPIVINI